jgi:TetR/AcrR family acrAB operon transcriptional repressor
LSTITDVAIDRSGQITATFTLTDASGIPITPVLAATQDPQLARVFDIAYHKCEYVGDAAALRERHGASQQECLRRIEKGLRNAIARGVLPAGVKPRPAAFGLLSLVEGIIANWVLDPGRFPLARHAALLVDTYLCGLSRTNPARPL